MARIVAGCLVALMAAGCFPITVARFPLPLGSPSPSPSP